jgi:hypothetical protein
MEKDKGYYSPRAQSSPLRTVRGKTRPTYVAQTGSLWQPMPAGRVQSAWTTHRRAVTVVERGTWRACHRLNDGELLEPVLEKCFTGLNPCTTTPRPTQDGREGSGRGGGISEERQKGTTCSGQSGPGRGPSSTWSRAKHKGLTWTLGRR